MWTPYSSVQVYCQADKKFNKGRHNDFIADSFWYIFIGFLGFCDSFQVIVNSIYIVLDFSKWFAMQFFIAES